MSHVTTVIYLNSIK